MARRRSASTPRCSSMPMVASSARLAAAATRTKRCGRRARRSRPARPARSIRVGRRFRGRVEAHLRRPDGGVHRADRAIATVFIFGAGHVGQFVGRIALKRDSVAVDDREKFANRERFPDAAAIIVDDIPSWLSRTTLPASSYAVVVTLVPPDLDAMRALHGADLRYLGLIGSRAKVKRIYDVLVETVRSPSSAWSTCTPRSDSTSAPAGPQEIAVSIVAELIAVRRGKRPRRCRRLAALDAELRAPQVLQPIARFAAWRNATIVTMNDALGIVGDVLIRDGLRHRRRRRLTADARLRARARSSRRSSFRRTCTCAKRCWGYADDLALLDWLKRRVWPMEAAHTPATLAASAARGGGAARRDDDGIRWRPCTTPTQSSRRWSRWACARSSANV